MGSTLLKGYHTTVRGKGFRQGMTPGIKDTLGMTHGKDTYLYTDQKQCTQVLPMNDNQND